jgi:hypothetical protein
MTDMAAPRSSTASTKTTGTTHRKPPAPALKTSPSKRLAPSAAKPAAGKPDAPSAGTLSYPDEAARMLHELRVNGQALSAQIARLAQRFL